MHVLAVFKSLTLLMLAHNERWPFIAAVLWTFVSAAVWIGVILAAFAVSVGFGLPEWAKIMVISAAAFPPMLFCFFAAMLFYEPIWMGVGFYRAFGVRDHYIREGLRKWATKKSPARPTP